MRNYISILLINLFILPFGQLSAQDYIVNVQQFGVEEGLLNRNLGCIFQDKSGFLWIPYERQLQRYDGYEFKSFPLPKSIGRPTNIESCDDEWLILLNTLHEYKLLFFNPLSGKIMTKFERWGTDLATQYDILTSNFTIGNVIGDKLYLTKQKGIFEVNLQTGLQKLVVPSSLLINKDDQVQLIDRQNNIWVRSETQMLVISPQQTLLRTYPKPFKVRRNMGLIDLDGQKTPIWAIKEVNKNGVEQQNLYIFKENGEQEYLASIPNEVVVHQFLDDQIWCISEIGWEVFDAFGNLLFVLDKKDYHKRLFEEVRYSLIIKDEFGKFYLPSQFGLNIIEVQKNRFTQYFSNTDKQPLPIKNSARGIDVKGDSIFVNFEFGGLVSLQKNNPEDFQILTKKFWNPHRKEFSSYAGRPIIRDSKNNFWTGSHEFWAIRFTNFDNPQKITLSKKLPKYPEEIPEFPEQIWSIFEDKNGCIWWGLTESLRKICPDGTPPVIFPHSELGVDFGSLYTYQFQEDKNGLFWICTAKGLFVFDETKRKFIAHYHEDAEGKYAIPATDIFFMHIDDNENRWLGTRSGLVFWNPKTDEKRLFTRNDGLSNNVIYAVFEDDYNKLWLSSDYGIMSFHKETFDVQAYLPKDGVAQQEFNRISHFQESDGTIYFGGLNGVTAFHPKDFEKIEKDYARMLISDFEIMDGEEGKLVNKFEEITKTQTINFKPNDRFFRLNFSLPTFEETSKMLYGWKIEGVDEDWNYQKENHIQIGILPYGSHTLRIKGQSGGGWSPHELAIQVHVLKPFYLQTWFILSSILALVLGIYLFFKRRTRLLKETQKLLESEIKKATAQIEQDKKIIEVQAEELRQLDKIKSRFFANVSHELRTPLTLMLGPISSAIKSGELNNRNFTLLKKAQTGGKDLLKLVSSILGLSKMEAGKMELNEKPELLFPLVRRIVSAFESHAQREGIQFEFHFHPEKQLQLRLDAEKLKIILNNLLSNAIKFTPKDKQVVVEIWDEGNMIKIMVRDTGRGIHPNDIPNIFNRFYQSAQPDAPTEGGTGIGLALTQEFIQMMNGEIWVESELGEGSSFYFKIPRKEVLGMVDGERWTVDGLENENNEHLEILDSEKEPKQDISTPIVPSTVHRPSSTVLIVEDNTSLRDYIQTVLSPYYNVLTAENGKLALEMLYLPPSLKGELPPTASKVAFETTGSGSPLGAGGAGENGQNSQLATRIPQLIISDIMMPIMDGFQLLKTLKSKDEFRHIPVIMLTARADISDKLQALRIGVDDYILKPFVEEELLARIDNLLQNYQERLAQVSETLGVTQVSDTSKVSDTSVKIPTISKEDQAWLTKLEAQIQKHLSNSQYSITQLSYDLAISERQLRRRIKQLIGLSPAQYLKAVRLQSARQLLEEKTYKTIAQTAAAVGFQDAGAFSRNFLNRFGKLPSDYLD